MIRSAWSDEWDAAVASLPARARAAEARARFEERMQVMAPALALASQIGINYRDAMAWLAAEARPCPERRTARTWRAVQCLPPRRRGVTAGSGPCENQKTDERQDRDPLRHLREGHHVAFGREARTIR